MIFDYYNIFTQKDYEKIHEIIDAKEGRVEKEASQGKWCFHIIKTDLVDLWDIPYCVGIDFSFHNGGRGRGEKLSVVKKWSFEEIKSNLCKAFNIEMPRAEQFDIFSMMGV